MQKKLIQKSDVIFTVVIVAAVLLMWLFMIPKESGTQAVIRQDGNVIATLPLSRDAQYEVVGKYHNTFEIKDGAIFVLRTDCPNHQCQKTGAVLSAGQTIVCAPNSVSVTISGEESIDGVTG